MYRKTKYAGVSIDSGPIGGEHFLRDVPVDQWDELLEKREWLITVTIPYYLQKLVEFIDDADRMYQAVGLSSAQELVEKRLKLDPERIRLAIEFLKRSDRADRVRIDGAMAMAELLDK